MMNPEFPARFYTKGDEPEPQRSINYQSGMSLMSKLETALRRDEWEYLCNSPLGVFIKFYKLEFDWSSQLVHYMLTSQLVCGQKYEIWCLIGAKPVRFSLNEFESLTGLNCEYIEGIEDPQTEVTAEMKGFWDKLGVRVEHGPSIAKLKAACGACESWTRDERLKLGYLSIYASFIDAVDRRSATRVGMARLVMDVAAFERYPWGRVAFKKLITSVKKAELTNNTYSIEGFVQVLQVWIYYALPNFGAKYGNPIIPAPGPVILSYKGCSRYRKIDLKAALLEQKRVQNFEAKEEYDEMFPLWDDDDEDDEKIHNIVKAFYNESGVWKFIPAHWSDVGVKSSEVVKGPNKKRKIDHLGEESEEGVLTLESIKNHFDACFTKLSSEVKQVLGTLTADADRDATNCMTTWKRILTKMVKALELFMKEQKEGAPVAAKVIRTLRSLTKRVEALEMKKQKQEATVAADRESTNMTLTSLISLD